MNKYELKRILIIAHDSSLYGASLSLLTILEHISKDRSFEVLLIIPYPGIIEEQLTEMNINYKIISFPRCVANNIPSISKKTLNILRYLKREINIMPELEAVAKKFQPDIIYTNTSVVTVGYKLARKINVPHAWHIREFGDYFQYLPSKRFVKRQISKSEKTIFVSQALRKHWINTYNNNCRVIYNGIVFDQSDNFTLSTPPEREFHFGLLGPITPGKGQETAIRGFSLLLKHFPDCKLHFFGDALDEKYLSYLMDLIIDLGCKERIKFHPFTSDKNIIYRSLHIVLNCSDFEGFGRTIVEAMSKGIPVIANASAGPLEIIDDGLTGLLYQKTSESLSEKMILLLSNPELYVKLSVNAIKKAHDDFSVDEYVNKVSTIFKCM